MIVLRPGVAPDTLAASEAGETWRWLGDVDTGGESALSRRTVAYLYRYVDHPELGSCWHGEMLCHGGKTSLLGSDPFADRLGAEGWVEGLLMEDGFQIVTDPHRVR
jgi:hypothetical protein